MQIFLDEILLTAPCCVHVVHIFRRSEKTSMMRNATWTLSNLCRGKPPPPFEWVQNLVDTRGCAAQHVCTDRNCFVRFENKYHNIHTDLLSILSILVSVFVSDICLLGFQQGFTCTWNASKPHLLFRLRGPNCIRVIRFSYTLHM